MEDEVDKKSKKADQDPKVLRPLGESRQTTLNLNKKHTKQERELFIRPEWGKLWSKETFFHLGK